MSKDDAPLAAPPDDSIPSDAVRPPENVAPAPAAEEQTEDLGSSARGVGRLGDLGGPTRLVLALAATAIVIYFMRSAASILAPAFLAMFIVMGMSPALQWMHKKGMSSGLALAIVLVVFIVLVFLFMGVMVSVMTQLDDKLPVYKANLEDMMSSVEAWFADRGMDISGLTGGALDPEKVIDFASKMINALIGMFSSVILMILIILFMVAEVYSFPNKLREKMHVSNKFAQAFYKFSDVTRTYLFTKAWLSAIMAVVVTLVYYAFGTDFAVAWGLLFFVLSFIPNIGFVLSVIPPFFITLLESGFTTAATVVIIVIVLNTIVDNGISPNIMGKSVGISSLVVFLSLMFWVWVLGGIGGLICVPLTLMVKILFFDNFESTQPISAFLEAGIRTKRKEKPKESFADRWRRRIHRKPKA